MRTVREYKRMTGFDVALVATVVVVGYVIIRRLGFFGSSPDGADVKKIADAPPPRSTFNPANEVSKLSTLLSNSADLGGEDNRAFLAILAYNDNELIAVHNYWRKKFAGGGGFFSGIESTLRKQIEAEVVWSWGRSDDAVQNKQKVIARLDRLGL